MVTVNCWVAPGASDAALGETLPLTGVWTVVVDEFAVDGPVAPVVPQPSSRLSARKPIMANASCFTGSPVVYDRFSQRANAHCTNCRATLPTLGRMGGAPQMPWGRMPAVQGAWSEVG